MTVSLMSGVCRAVSFIGIALIAGCAREIGGEPVLGDGGDDGGQQGMDAGMDADMFGNGPVGPTLDASFADYDASTNPDAFFVNDPLPPYCGPDPDHMVDPVTGSLACPSDKNREGCPCETAGEEAACWPGKRLNREHGICKDGMTRCIDTEEFGLRWAPCEGYVLPVQGATEGPEACGCFSSGRWALSNLSPCIFRGATNTWLYSSKLNADGTLNCGTITAEPPPVPDGIWSTSSLNVDCEGQFTLCFTIKAGDVTNPQDNDCVVMEVCNDVNYEEARADQTLPDLPAWRSLDSACAGQFDTRGGYGEMSVLGESVECDQVDDGAGGRYVFHRTNYCPPSCQQTPTAPGCVECRTGGSGEF
jgi:hypothetical protein